VELETRSFGRLIWETNLFLGGRKFCPITDSGLTVSKFIVPRLIASISWRKIRRIGIGLVLALAGNVTVIANILPRFAFPITRSRTKLLYN
jgi:hypothetical protein